MQKASFAALFLASSIAASALLPIGCSTGEADSLFSEGPPNSADATGSASGAGGSGGIGLGGSGPGSTSSGDPSGSTSSTSGGMGGSGMGGSGMGGMGGSGMGGMGMGGMGGSGDTDVLCGGGEQCPLAGDGACCWSEEQDSGYCVMGPDDMDNCSQSQQGGNARIECQTDSECGAGMQCCGDRANGNFGLYYYQVTCQADCQDVTLCATQGAGAGECPKVNCQGQQVQGQCNPSQLLPPGYLVCGCP